MTPEERWKMQVERHEALTKKIEMELACKAEVSDRIRALEQRAIGRARKLGLEDADGDPPSQA